MVEIRPFRQGDEEDLVFHANNSRVADSLRDSFPYPYTFNDAREWIETCKADKENLFIRAITLNDKVIGGIGALCDSDVHRFNAEVGYWLGEEYWGRGFATQSLEKFVAWIFANTSLNRLYAGVFDFNPASMRVLYKVGFRLEAIHKDAIFKKNQFWDEQYYVKFRPRLSTT